MVNLLTMLLEAAGPDLTPDSLVTAADDHGTFDLAGLPGSSPGPGKRSAGNAMRIYEYDSSAFALARKTYPFGRRPRWDQQFRRPARSVGASESSRCTLSDDIDGLTSR